MSKYSGARLRLIRATHVSNPQQKSALVSTSLAGSGISIYLSRPAMRHERGTYFTSAAHILTVVGHITQHPSIYISSAMYTSTTGVPWLRSVYCTSMDIRYKSQSTGRDVPKACQGSQKVFKEEKAKSQKSIHSFLTFSATTLQ